jgi:ribonuclease VapC
MFLDASAILAILNREPGADALVHLLGASAKPTLFSPLSRFEAVISLARSRSGTHRSATPAQIETAKAAVDLLLVEVQAEPMPITAAIGDTAIVAAQTYGRAVGHAADLNFGDCFAYACAKSRDAPLLYKGSDFSRTDLA